MISLTPTFIDESTDVVTSTRVWIPRTHLFWAFPMYFASCIIAVVAADRVLDYCPIPLILY
jgi:hypothetical protein